VSSAVYLRRKRTRALPCSASPLLKRDPYPRRDDVARRRRAGDQFAGGAARGVPPRRAHCSKSGIGEPQRRSISSPRHRLVADDVVWSREGLLGSDRLDSSPLAITSRSAALLCRRVASAVRLLLELEESRVDLVLESRSPSSAKKIERLGPMKARFRSLFIKGSGPLVRHPVAAGRARCRARRRSGAKQC